MLEARLPARSPVLPQCTIAPHDTGAAASPMALVATTAVNASEKTAISRSGWSTIFQISGLPHAWKAPIH